MNGYMDGGTRRLGLRSAILDSRTASKNGRTTNSVSKAFIHEIIDRNGLHKRHRVKHTLRSQRIPKLLSEVSQRNLRGLLLNHAKWTFINDSTTIAIRRSGLAHSPQTVAVDIH